MLSIGEGTAALLRLAFRRCESLTQHSHNNNHNIETAYRYLTQCFKMHKVPAAGIRLGIF